MQKSPFFHKRKTFTKKYESLRSRGGGRVTQTLVVQPHLFNVRLPLMSVLVCKKQGQEQEQKQEQEQEK